MPHVQAHTLRAQPLQPGAQQRRGLHRGRKHTLRAADKSVHPQAFCPDTQFIRTKTLQPWAQGLGTLGVARGEGRQRLGMCQVQATHTREQKLAACRRHAVKHMHLQALVHCRLRGH